MYQILQRPLEPLNHLPVMRLPPATQELLGVMVGSVVERCEGL
ncbi:hypothetical protein [Xanthomonas axonopodis]